MGVGADIMPIQAVELAALNNARFDSERSAAMRGDLKPARLKLVSFRVLRFFPKIDVTFLFSFKLLSPRQR